MLERARYIRDMQQRHGASDSRPKHRLQPAVHAIGAIRYLAIALASETWGAGRP